ncbi:DNA-dependent protein kinase catalytic subunit-like [Macrobrachium nipponense]|uniref:DNA-dependent protein kinase catalytic subunit-like n=1 Tax=Macrobrachium nipponense TaxID=159736 RepID=UPI0030C8BBCF
MAGSRRDEIEILLENLHSCGLRKTCATPAAVKDIVVDISDHLSIDLTPVQFELYLSQLFGENGIIAFGRSYINEVIFSGARESTLDVIEILLKKDSTKISKYADDILKYSLFLYKVDKDAKVRSKSLEVFRAVIQKFSSSLDIEEVDLDSLVERLWVDIKNNKLSTVLQQQLHTLGMLLYCYPEVLAHRARLVLKILKDQLKKHMGSPHNLVALTGVLKGYESYLHHFPLDVENSEERNELLKMYEELYGSLKKIINPNLKLDRRAAPRACLDIFHVHGGKFAVHLFEDVHVLFPWLIQWSSHYNRDDRKFGVRAMDTFTSVIADELVLRAEKDDSEGKKVFKYLIHEYSKLLETGTSTLHISLAVKGYGRLSGACCRYLSPLEVNTMFNQVLAASQYSFYQSSEMLDNKLANLPSYIESLATIINNMLMVSDFMLESVLKLTLSMLEDFQLVPEPLRHLAFLAVFSLFYTVYKKAEFLLGFLHSFVYRFILITCSHEPDIDTTIDQGSGRGEKWRGLKNEIVTYKTFLPVWKAFLTLEKVANINVKDMPAPVKTEISSILYSNFIICILEISEKLNLETFKGTEEKLEDDASQGENVTSDPVSGLRAKTPKDFQVYMNLVALLDEVLPLQSDINMEQHVPRLIHYFVRKSLSQPLVSAHYSAITTILKCSRYSFLFNNKEDPRSVTVIHMIKSYTVEMLQRCRQYRDQLLVSVLILILQLPDCVVMDIFPELIPALQMALRLGVSYLPLAEICVKALQNWSQLLPKDILQKYFPSVMPLLLPYLRSQESGGQAEVYARVMTVKMAFARQRRKVDQKKMLESKQVDETLMRKVQKLILHLVGNLDPSLSLSIIPQDPDSLAEAAVTWDTIKHVKFATPFEQTKIDIHLDGLLPYVVDIAVNSSDRQTKVAASELLHAVVIFMIGTGTQKSPETQEKYPMAPLYRHVFRAMLQLSCDPDQVTRQLFITLIYQTIHWFTNNRNFENPDTVVLLETIMDGIVTPNDPALRDVSAQCLSEFAKWSRKQCHRKDQVSANVKSIIKRLLSFCKHPSAFKRLGGSLAWNSIYREFREDAVAVDTWTLEILVGLLVSLEWAHRDDPALGTQEQAQTAVQHVERILREKKEVFWKKSAHRRIPRDFVEGTLDDLLQWLIKQIGKPKMLYRHKCLELLVSLAPITRGEPTIQKFIEQLIKRDGFDKLLDIVEGGGEALVGIRHYPKPIHNEQLAVKNVVVYLEALLAALDGHCWLLGQNSFSVKGLCSFEGIKIFDSVQYFIENMSCVTLDEYLENIYDKEKCLSTPVEMEVAVKLKCTAVIRTLDFVKLVLQDTTAIESGVLDKMLSSQYFTMILLCLLNPKKIGFDLKDLEVEKKLPEHMEDVLNILNRKVSQPKDAVFVDLLENQLINLKNDLSKTFPSSQASFSPISKQFLDGLRILHNTGLLAKCSVVPEDVAKNILVWIANFLFSERTAKPVPYMDSSHHQLLESLVDLSFTTYPEVHKDFLSLATSNEMIIGPGGKEVRKGTHVMNVVGTFLIPHFAAHFDVTMTKCMELLQTESFESGMSFASMILDFLIRNSVVRKMHGVCVLKSFLNNWPTFILKAGEQAVNQESLLNVLASLFLIDREGTIKANTSDPRSEIVIFFRGILNQRFELKLKVKALKLLPFFLTLSETITSSVCESLNVMSVNHFPLRSAEFTPGSSKDREYHQALNEILTALELSKCFLLLDFVAELFCREENHRYEEDLQPALEKFIRGQSSSKQIETLHHVYEMFSDLRRTPNFRQNIVDQILVPLLQQSGIVALERFLVNSIKDVMNSVSLPVTGRNEEQQKILISKNGSYSILQVMYSRLPREKLFAPGSEVSAAFCPADKTGKEMTKEVFRCASKISKGELRHDQTNAEWRRLCACASYNAIIAVLVCVQNDLRFYTQFLFQANAAKGEAIWESLIDCNVKHEFDVEVNFKPGSKKRFVALRQSLKVSAGAGGTGMGAGTFQFNLSHYLADSSLREDLSQFDFNNSVVLAMSQTEDARERMQIFGDFDGELMTLNLDQSDYNEHETMANLVAVINHIVEAKIMTLPKEGVRSSEADVPQWMMSIKQKLENSETHRNVKLFLLRLMMNTSHVFAHYAAHFVIPILSCIAEGTVGDRINYFLSDLLVMLLNWGEEGIPEDSILGKNIANRVFLRLCKFLPHNRADIFKYNIDVIRTVVEKWKNILTVPYTIMYSLMEEANGQNREVDAGLHLLGIVLEQGIAPHSAESDSDKIRCRSSLVKLMCGKGAAIYGAASEVLGLYLKFMKKQNEETADLEGSIVKKINEAMHEKSSQALTCIYNIQKHYPSIVNCFINKLLNLLPKLYGIHRTQVLKCIVSYSTSLEDVFTHLKEQNLTETLIRKESETQLVALQLINSVMVRLTPSQLLYFMPGVVAFANHPAPKCREEMYDVLKWIYNHYSDSTEEDCRQLESEAKAVLLEAVMEKDAILREDIMQFWLEGSENKPLHQRLLHILQKVYSPEREGHFLPLATYMLLSATRKSADYERKIFDQPLTECKFREMRVTTAWRARHASMVPMFAETQGIEDTSLTSLVSLTQGIDNVDGAHEGKVQATQQRAFTETQQPGASLVSGSTFDTTMADIEYQVSHTPGQGSAKGLLFTVGSSGKRDMSHYKTPGLGRSRLQPPADNEVPDPASITQSKLIRRRFVRDQDREKQSNYFAKLESQRRKTREAIHKERKLRREAQVTMYREYRVGELPDIQIQYKAIIAPLQALAQHDNRVSGVLLELLLQGIIDTRDYVMDSRTAEDWFQDIHSALNAVLASSLAYSPQLLRTVLHLMIKNDVTVNPDTLCAACLDSHLEALGILVLERQVHIRMREDQKPPARKRKKTEASQRSLDDNLWLNMAELYKNLDMWDIVCGIIQKNLGNIQTETRLALEAEATNNPTQAFRQYRMALEKEWEEEPGEAEVRIWKDWYANCAGTLGQWSELESFIERSFLKDDSGNVNLERVWLLPRPGSVVLPSLINSKLMRILDGSDNDGNLVDFINNALENPSHRALIEGSFLLQLSVLAIHQDKGAHAQSYLTTAMEAMLQALSQYSIITPKPLKNTIRHAQLLSELEDFLKCSKYGMFGSNHSRIRRVILSWKNQEADPSDNSFLIQYMSSYRDLYLHCLGNQSSENFDQIIRDVKMTTYQSVVRAALQNGNYHLADRHLRKLKSVSLDNSSLAQFYFLMTENSLLRARCNPEKCLDYLFDAWSKYLGKVSASPILEEVPELEVTYLTLESSLSLHISEVIREMGAQWHHQQKYIEVLASRFPGAQARDNLHDVLLQSGFNCLVQAASICEDKFSSFTQNATRKIKDAYMKLSRYCEECIEIFKDKMDVSKYSRHLIIAVLKGMKLGDQEAHYQFPRLISILEENSSLIETFKLHSGEVPEWMFLLWLSHILIYLDKTPGPALQPIVEKLAAEYPQSLVYAFRISKQQYNYTTAVGKTAEVMSQKVECILTRNSLFQQIPDALSLVIAPYIVCMDALSKLRSEKNKSKIEERLKDIEESLLKVSVRSTKGLPIEKGEAYIKLDRLRKALADSFGNSFGHNFKKIQAMSLKQVHDHLNAMYKIFLERGNKDIQALPRQLKSYSPWLASFQSSRYSHVIEIPGQYSGLSKPLPEYHVKISNFDENILVMPSLRVPMRIVIRGDDEKDYKFLVKWGEDLRTDQRMQQVFGLMNKIYASSSLCANLTSRPSLDTFQVIPLLLNTGLLQWVESTRPMQAFLEDSAIKSERDNLVLAERKFRVEENYNPNNKSKMQNVLKVYEEVVNLIPWDLLRRGIVELACNSESFFYLRSSFAVSYATLCISHWMVGIGDRHCGNFLISVKTGRVVGIDFGHHFETSAQVIGVPELMPFRLTPQICNVFQPMSASGTLREIMVAALGALRNSHHLLMAVLEAFVKEPTEDWKYFVKILEGSTEDDKIELYSHERISILKAKLSGVNPSYVTKWAIYKNKNLKRDPSILPILTNVILGDKRDSLRSDVDRNDLNPHEQVDILLDLACDPNILGRTYCGWRPYY